MKNNDGEVCRHVKDCNVQDTLVAAVGRSWERMGGAWGKEAVPHGMAACMGSAGCNGCGSVRGGDVHRGVTRGRE